jgi:hypothetical protein
MTSAMSSAVSSADVASSADSTGASVQSSAVASSAASSMAVSSPETSSPEMSSSAESSAPVSSSAASSSGTSTSSASSAPSTSSRAEGTISGSGGTIKAGAGLKLPTKFDGWTQVPNPTDGIIFFKNGDYTITASFLAGSDYTGMQETVTGRRTKVGAGVCGWTHDPDNLLCELKTADGVIGLSAEGTDTPLVALVDFADQLTKTLGTT